VFYLPLNQFLCRAFGAYFNSEWWWFILSDVSMYYLYKYYVESHVSTTKKHIYSEYKDVELDEESDLVHEHDSMPLHVQPRYVQAPQAQPQPIYYVPMPYYPTPMYYAPQVTPVYHTQQ